LGAWLGLPAGQEGGEVALEGLKATLMTWAIDLVLFLPGAALGGAVGWVVIRPVNWALGRLFAAFNWIFERTTQAYGKTVGFCLRQSVFVLLIYVALIGLTGFGFTRVPSGFVPIQDKGYLVVNIQLPDSASLERTVEVTEAVEKIALDTPGVAHTVAIPGLSFVLNANSSNYGNMFVILKPFHERQGTSVTGEAIVGRLRARFQREVPEARVLAFAPPAVRGLGNAGGFKLMVEATGEPNFDALQARADELAAKGNREPGLVGLFNGFRARTPQLYADVDRTKVRTMGVAITDVFDALQTYLGSYYVNDFNRFGRTWQVNVQADAPFRNDPETVKQLKVRNADGEMVPLGAVVDIRESAGPVTITRYNMFPAATITGSWQPGISTGEVLRTMERLSDKELPRSMTYEWTELSYLQNQASKIEQFRDLRQNPFSAFVLGAVLVFFVLAGLYESWSTPLAVILVVPMCLLSALAGTALRGLDVNIFVQIGFVVLVGLACKNAILIVEFAKQQRDLGKSRREAIVNAALTRLRPIVMTSACFVHMVPPCFATGAGAEMRRSLGTAVLWGAFGVTLFGIFLTPVFFYVVDWLTNRKGRPAAAPTATIREGPARTTPGVNHANNGVAAHASVDLMYPGTDGGRS
jgi:hydrophobe/amphiphile efflux-1 (HAE1) family protein